MGVIYNRLKDLNVAEMQEVKHLTEGAYAKFQRDFYKSKLIVDIHKFEKAGARAKYSVHFRLEGPSLLLTAEEVDWELSRALHKTIANMGQEIQHTFKRDAMRKTGKKPY